MIPIDDTTCFSRLTHERGNLGKVAFFPQRFVWIHDESASRGMAFWWTLSHSGLLPGALCTSDSDFAFAVAHVPIPRGSTLETFYCTVKPVKLRIIS